MRFIRSWSHARSMTSSGGGKTACESATNHTGNNVRRSDRHLIPPVAPVKTMALKRGPVVRRQDTQAVAMNMNGPAARRSSARRTRAAHWKLGVDVVTCSSLVFIKRKNRKGQMLMFIITSCITLLLLGLAPSEIGASAETSNE